MKIFLVLLLFVPALSFQGISQPEHAAGDTLVYEVDTAGSYLSWSCDKHFGSVPLKSGELKVLNDKPVGGKFVILMDSLKDLDIDYKLMRETLHNTLKSKFFFDVVNYPVADFDIDYIQPLGKERYQVTGNLTIKGVVNCIGFKSTVHIDGKKFSAVSDKFFIDRTQYGITIYSQSEAVDDNSVIVSDEIYFVIHLSGVLRY